MGSQLTAYLTLICFSGLMNLYLCIHMINKRKIISSARIYIYYTICVASYCFIYAIGLTSETLEQILFWNTIQYITMPLLPPLSLLLILHYLGHNIKPVWIVAMIIPSSLSSLLVATNSYHHFFYKSFIIHPVLGIPYVHIEVGYWYIMHSIYMFNCLFIGLVLLINRWRETSTSYRKQLLILIIGQIIPIITCFFYLVGITPAGIDPVPIVLWMTSILYIWAILEKEMLTLRPIAKEVLFHMSEGVIVLDKNLTLIEYNHTATDILPNLKPSLIGEPFNLHWNSLTSSKDSFTSYIENEYSDFSMLIDEQYYFYQIRRTFIKDKKDNIIGLLLLIIDVNLTKQLQFNLEKLAHYDGLTQIFNRTYFLILCDEKLQASIKANLEFSIIYFDIDHFKNVNDTYGHHIGDKLLIHIAQQAKLFIPNEGLLARFGGEEFIIALPGYGLEEAKEIASNIRAHFEQNPLIDNDILLNNTASFGVASYQENETLQQIINLADQALYEVKRNGKNDVRSALMQNNPSL